MAQLTGVSVNRLDGGLGRRTPSTDNVVALVAAMPLDSLSLIENQAKELLQITDAESIGVNQSYDANTKTLVHHHLSEIFRLSPDATVYLIPTATDVNVEDVLDGILPTIRANESIKGIAFTGFKNNLDDIPIMVDVVQDKLVNQLFSEQRYIDFVLLEGKANVVIKATDLVDLRTNAAPNVSVILAQDPNIASIDLAYGNYAAVGSALGMLSIRKVNENIGSVNIVKKPAGKKGLPDYPLTDAGKKLWLTANLSDGNNAQSLSKVDLKTLTKKGYIYASSYEGYGGIFFSNAPTCVERASDYAFIENNRTWNKAARIIRQTLIPEVKGTVKKDVNTGFIRSTTISRWSGLLNRALERMIIDDEISGFNIYIEPKQYLTEAEPLRIKAQLVKDDIVHEFEVDLGYTQQIQ